MLKQSKTARFKLVTRIRFDRLSVSKLIFDRAKCEFLIRYGTGEYYVHRTDLSEDSYLELVKVKWADHVHTQIKLRSERTPNERTLPCIMESPTLNRTLLCLYNPKKAKEKGWLPQYVQDI